MYVGKDRKLRMTENTTPHESMLHSSAASPHSQGTIVFPDGAVGRSPKPSRSEHSVPAKRYEPSHSTVSGSTNNLLELLA
jgi:hypothetical protein